ncbi:hypothetical protein [Nodosilinea sp. FACHB-13]|uniref:hypothetical protein n=1 Tax=Cyanophyceae TaxID=3028117 RepID=UPI001683607B|nr:hypothetical protein [Nodosilinea sp. FACHB-13]MBD2108953.1 hypothetical protein [Nodosilinea sp. FACHB-13]
MATQPTNPFQNSSGAASAVPATPARMALDNLLRRELKVSDPNDAKLVAEALLTRYKDTPKAIAISREAQGVPFLTTSTAPLNLARASTSSDAELQQAMDDIERDLQELTTNTILKDITLELQGWASAIRSTLVEGSMAARFALDPRQRDKAFGARRSLGDYARIARLVGALTPALNINYRKLAQSLDEAAAVLLVIMGESLANVSFSGGRFLLQAPYSELQVRRDAAIYALRNLVGSTQDAYGPNEWPRGLDAYRRLYDTLEQQGQGDLRALLVEGELSRMMDVLIQRAAHGNADGLRALGATAQLDLERFRRLITIGQRLVVPESPPLTTFLSALQLFADSFNSSGGFRLLRVARPPILFYGLYGIGGLEDADQRLLALIIQRGVLAEQLDCFLQCGCTSEAVRCQIILDKILYDVDRSIDLYALGNENFGEPERRAAAYGFLIEVFLGQVERPCILPENPLHRVLGLNGGIQAQLWPTLSQNDPIIRRIVEEVTWFGEGVLAQLANFPNQQRELNESLSELKSSPLTVGSIGRVYGLSHQGRAQLLRSNSRLADRLEPSAVLAPYLNILHQELCIQRETESRWRDLVMTMAPSCITYDEVFTGLSQVIERAIEMVSGTPICEQYNISLPPHYETSLDGLVNNVLPDGLNRDY